MSLSIEIGTYADQLHFDPEGAEWIKEDIEIINDILLDRNLPTHTEPDSMPDDLERTSLLSFPYSYMQTLRRAYALVRSHRSVTPLNGGQPSSEDEGLIEELTEKLDSHLLCHSDEEGYYVPVPFAKPIKDDDLPGEYLGSSQSLLKELQLVAASIDIILVDGRLPAALQKVISTLDDDKHPFSRERIVWHALFEAATGSIEYGSAIVFH